MSGSIRLTVVCVATGKTIEVYADKDDRIVDVKRRINEREGFENGEYPLCRVHKPRRSVPSDIPKLDVLTKSLGQTVTNLAADSPERRRQLEAWLGAVDTKLGKGLDYAAGTAAVPQPEARVLLDDWDLARCRLQEGDVLSYGPWCPAQSAALSIDRGDSTIAQRMERTGAEQRQIVDGLLSPVLEERRAEVIDLIIAKDDSQDRAALSELTDTELHERAKLARVTEEALSKVEVKVRSVGTDRLKADAPAGNENDEVHRQAKLGYDLRVAVTRGFVQAVKDHIANGAPVDHEDEMDRSTSLAVAVTRSGAPPVYTNQRAGRECEGRERALNLELVDVLLAAGADPNHADIRGWTPMHKAASVGSIEALRAMRSNPPPRQGKTNAQDSKGWTCLHWCKTPEVAKVLLEELGAKDDIKNSARQTPEQMHFKRAASKASGLADFLRARRADINANKKPWE